MPTITCPTAKQLAAFQSGKLARAELDQIADHLETCPACQTALQADSTISDALLRELKQADAPDTYADESDCRRAVARIEALANVSAMQTRDETADDGPPAPMPGKTLGKYLLLEPIGQGGMGTVYKAVHTLLKRTVAIKVLPPNRLKDLQAVNRFRREIEAAGRLDHPNIVRTSDADEADGQHFLVMEWLPGQDLSKYVRDHGPLPVDQACDFIRQAALGLACAHEHGMVHRDVKPSNLFLASRERQRPEEPATVKVLDLGLALLHGNVTESELTSDGQVMGTYDFIAPEQAMESHSVDHRADIYSLGCTFYFLLTGRTPFQGKSEAKKLLAHQLEEPTPIETHRSDVPAEMVGIIKKMMAKDPAKRHASMRDVAESLAPLAGRASDGGPSGPAKEGHPSLVRPANKAPAAQSRRPFLIAASIVLGVAAVIALVFGIIRISTPEGDYVIETDDPTFAFSVSKGTVILEDKLKKRTYEVRVVENKGKGEWELEVLDPANDLEFKTREFTIKRGEKVDLKMWFDRKEIAVTPAKKATTGQTLRELMIVKNFVKKDSPPIRGDWRIEEPLLIQAARKPSCILFGDKNWSDYNLEVEGKHVSGPGSLTVIFRAVDGRNYHAFALGSYRGTFREVYRVENGDWIREFRPVAAKMERDRWYKVRIEARGGAFRCFVDGNKVSEFTDPQFPRGMVGFGTWETVTYFRNIKVTAADDKTVLWDGLPRLAVAENAVKPRNPLILTGHTGLVWCVAFNSDGTRLASGSKDGTVKLWDATTGRLIKDLASDPSRFTGLAWTPNGKLLAGCGGSKTIKIWNGDTGEIMDGLNGHDGAIRCLAVSADSKLLASGSDDNTVKVWDLITGKVEHTFVGHSNVVHGVAFSPDRQYVASASWDGSVKVWSLITGKEHRSFSGHQGNVLSVAFDKDGQRLASGGRDGTVRLWNLARPDEEPIQRGAGLLGRVFGVAFNPESPLLAIGSDNTLRLWDPVMDTEKILETDQGELILGLAFTRNGRRLAVAGGDSTVKVWDVPIVGEIRRYLGHAGGIRHLAFSPDGKSFLSGGYGEFWLWDVDKTAERIRFPNTHGFIASGGFSKDGDRVVGTAQVGSVVVWMSKVKPGEKVSEVARFTVPNWAEWVALSPDRPHVFYTNRNGGRIYDIDKKAELPTRFLGGLGSLSMDGRRLLTGDGRTLYLWDVDTGKELSNVDCGRSMFRMALAADGRHALAAAGNNVLQWDMDEKKQGRILETPASVQAVAISPDGKRALTGGFDKKLRYWDLATGKELFCFEGHTGPVSAVAFAPNGRQALSGSEDKTIRLWQLPADEIKPKIEPKVKVEVGEVRRYVGHRQEVRCVAWAPDGKSFFSGSFGEPWLWDVDSTLERQRLVGVQGWVHGGAISYDGAKVIAGGQGGVAVMWDAKSGKKLHDILKFKVGGPIENVVCAPDQPLVYFSNSGGVRVFDCDKKQDVPRRFQGERISLSRDGRRLLTCDGKTLYLWDANTGKEVSRVQHTGHIISLALAPDGRHAAVSVGSVVTLWDMEAKKMGKRLDGPARVHGLAISPDGKRALSGGADGKLRLWSLETGKELHCFDGHSGPILCVAFAPDGRRALSGSEDKSIRLWQLPVADVKTSATRAVLPLATSAQLSGPISQLSVSRDGTRMVAYSSDIVLAYWELDPAKATFKSGWKNKVPMVRGVALDPAGSKALLAIGGSSNLHEIDTQTGNMSERRKGRHDGANGLVFSADGQRYLVADFYGGISLRDTQEGEVLRKFQGHIGGSFVRTAPQVCFSRDGERILTSGADHTVRLWDSTNADELKKLPFAAARKRFIALSPDGKQALISQDNDVQVWDLTTGKSVGALKGHKDHVTAVAYGPDGAWAVSASQDKTLRVWDVATGKALARLDRHSDDVTCVAVAAQGRLVISASRDKTLRAWKWTE